jgi:hypothetical protein
MPQGRPRAATSAVGAVAVLALLTILSLTGYLPEWISRAILGTGLFVATFGLVLVLFVRQSRWRRLSARYPASPAFTGTWRTCRTSIVSPVALGESGYRQNKVVFIFAMRVGADEQALYLSGASVFRLLLPPVRVPWSAIVRVRHFEANAWTDRPQALHTVQFVYDPGYSGPFVELEVADPHLFIQLPAAQIKEALAHLPA